MKKYNSFPPPKNPSELSHKPLLPTAKAFVEEKTWEGVNEGEDPREGEEERDTDAPGDIEAVGVPERVTVAVGL